MASVGAVALAGSEDAADSSGEQPPEDFEFDFDNGNIIRDVIITRGSGVFPEETVIGPMDASIFVWITSLFQLSWYDATAPYHPTAVGVYSKIPRRPASESETNRNKNIAILYAGLRVLQTVYPERALVLAQGMQSVGLDPEDQSEDVTTPIGIGNVAGKAIAEARKNDGMNLLGNEGREYNGQPFDDYTGYEPVNSPYKVVNPSRWQPAMHPHMRRVGGGPGDKGIWVIQRIATPQLRLATAFTFDDPDAFDIARPDHSDHKDRRKYKRSVDQVLSASASLTDEQKAMAEWFDNKLAGVAQAPAAAAEAHDLDLDGWVQLYAVTALARFDDMIAAWHQKIKYDTVRPFTAVRHIYGRKKVTAWGGVGKGTVDDMPADQWASYLPVGDHPEYPSGSTTLCAAEAQAARRLLGDDRLEWTYSFPAGSLLTEPGAVPAKDLEMHWPTWTDFLRDCGDSRVWGGVHFQTTVDRSKEWGLQFGDMAYDFMDRHIRGEA